jgi:tetratricopeptide (TPR) repeat protein
MKTSSNFPEAGLWVLMISLSALNGLAEGALSNPWQAYNEGVQGYARGDYSSALKSWQDLTVQGVPKALRSSVWFQLGNAQFRLGEPIIVERPEETVELWRRSREAYRTVLASRPRDQSAKHNLALVENRLAHLLHRLGTEAFQAALNKPPDEAIDQLRGSLDHLEEATGLAPDEPVIRQDLDKALQVFRQRLLERAQKAESKGDQAAAQTNSWAEREAEDKYREALRDLADAHRSSPTPPATSTPAVPPGKDTQANTIAAAEDRVNTKLSQLLTRMGVREQKAGKQQEDGAPDQALGAYDRALDHFQAAQEAQPDNREAQRGEREVKAAMEKLQVGEGRAELARGKVALEQKNPRAASALTQALGHFEAALELNDLNQEAQAGAEEARRLLPDALTLAGKGEMKSGERSEKDSSAQALGHYEEAEKDFSQSLALRPGDQETGKGQREAQEKVARLREKVSQEAEQNRGKQRSRSLQSLLGQVAERDRQLDPDRQRQRGRKDVSEKKNPLDW